VYSARLPRKWQPFSFFADLQNGFLATKPTKKHEMAMLRRIAAYAGQRGLGESAAASVSFRVFSWISWPDMVLGFLIWIV
jgi:hypothetical protein